MQFPISQKTPDAKPSVLSSSVKSDDLLADSIARNRNAAAEPARQMEQMPQQAAIAQVLVKRGLSILDVLPERLLLFQILFRAALDEQDGGNRRDNLQIVAHVSALMRIRDRLQIDTFHQQPVDQQCLIDAANHDLLIEEGINESDALIALTGMDEENIKKTKRTELKRLQNQLVW